MIRRSSISVAAVALLASMAACGGGESEVSPTTTVQEQPSSATTASSPPTTPGTVTSVPAPSSAEPTAGSGCEILHEPGEYEGVGIFGDVEQPYWMVVPTSYSDVAPAPLYVNIPTGTGSHDAHLDGWRPYLDDVNGLMLIPNASDSRAVSPDAIVSLIDHVSAEYCVNPKRVHAMGTVSAIAEDLACEASDRIASFVSAEVQTSAGLDCTPDRPVPLLTYTGDTDRSATSDLVARWSSINGCDPEPAVDDLGSGVLKKTFQNCEADVVFYDFQGMGHCFVFHEAKGPAAPYICEYEQFDHLEDATEFFAEHPLQ